MASVSSSQKRYGLASRVLMSALFLLSGTNKLANVKTTQEYMEAYNVPGYLLYPAAAFEIASGIFLLIEYKVKHLGILLAGWCLLTGAIFHTEFGDQTQFIMFFKNLVMAGGFLVLAELGGRTR